MSKADPDKVGQGLEVLWHRCDGIGGSAEIQHVTYTGKGGSTTVPAGYLLVDRVNPPGFYVEHFYARFSLRPYAVYQCKLLVEQVADDLFNLVLKRFGTSIPIKCEVQVSEPIFHKQLGEYTFSE